MTPPTPPFDAARAHLSDTDDFPPYNVEPSDERPLRDVLASGEIQPDTELVITERARPPNPPNPAPATVHASGSSPFPVSTFTPLPTKPADDPPPLAFIDRQLAFHHVAQGKSAGHPWLVSF